MLGSSSWVSIMCESVKIHCLSFTWLSPLGISVALLLMTIIIIVKITQFKRQCKGQTYKTAEIILPCHKVMCLFHTEPFTCELIAKRHSLSCHYKWTITNTSTLSSHLNVTMKSSPNCVNPWNIQNSRTKRYQPFLNYALAHFQNSKWISVFYSLFLCCELSIV